MKRISLKVVFYFYAGLFFVALAWIWLRGDPHFFVHPEWDGPLDGQSLLRGAGLGLATALAVVILSRLSSIYFAWARSLEREFAELLGPLSFMEIVVIAVLSGVAEEAFFRAALQPTLGWAAATIIFGLLHVGPSRSFLPWTLSAFVLGGLLGWYYTHTGTLVAPVVCHTAINLVNLTFIQRARPKMPVA
ncbi:MAG: CPBP family intramembrane metalloprotease [Myxococcales bacterium]|nr:MAG: CPBP family intramembrane metalloprotease [Myxococcales bacterium]